MIISWFIISNVLEATTFKMSDTQMGMAGSAFGIMERNATREGVDDGEMADLSDRTVVVTQERTEERYVDDDHVESDDDNDTIQRENDRVNGGLNILHKNYGRKSLAKKSVDPIAHKIKAAIQFTKPHTVVEKKEVVASDLDDEFTL